MFLQAYFDEAHGQLSHRSTDSALQNLVLTEWAALLDLEAILNITAIATTLAQCERLARNIPRI